MKKTVITANSSNILVFLVYTAFELRDDSGSWFCVLLAEFGARIAQQISYIFGRFQQRLTTDFNLMGYKIHSHYWRDYACLAFIWPSAFFWS